MVYACYDLVYGLIPKSVNQHAASLYIHTHTPVYIYILVEYI